MLQTECKHTDDDGNSDWISVTRQQDKDGNWWELHYCLHDGVQLKKKPLKFPFVIGGEKEIVKKNGRPRT